MQKIILTDYPKLKHISANLRGVATEKLLKLRDQLFSTMMSFTDEEAGGYAIFYDAIEIVKELEFRGEKSR